MVILGSLLIPTNWNEFRSFDGTKSANLENQLRGIFRPGARPGKVFLNLTKGTVLNKSFLHWHRNSVAIEQ